MLESVFWHYRSKKCNNHKKDKKEKEVFISR